MFSVLYWTYSCCPNQQTGGCCSPAKFWIAAYFECLVKFWKSWSPIVMVLHWCISCWWACLYICMWPYTMHFICQYVVNQIQVCRASRRLLLRQIRLAGHQLNRPFALTLQGSIWLFNSLMQANGIYSSLLVQEPGLTRAGQEKVLMADDYMGVCLSHPTPCSLWQNVTLFRTASL